MFFLTTTPGSKLLKMLKKTEAENQIDGNSRIKFIETSGRKFIDHLRINDPFDKKCEPVEKCLACDSSQVGTNCKVTNVGYTIMCKTCKERNITKAYEGETCRNAYPRGLEHAKALEKKQEGSLLYKHIVAEHKEEEDNVKFEMKITGRFKDAMSRQIDESYRINNRNPKSLLNSKNEFHGPVVRRKMLENFKNQS